MAAQTCPHSVVHTALRRVQLRHIAMASGAADLRACVGSMLELHQRLTGKSVDALPRNFVVTAGIFGYLPNLWFVYRDPCMTQHALPY